MEVDEELTYESDKWEHEEKIKALEGWLADHPHEHTWATLVNTSTSISNLVLGVF